MRPRVKMEVTRVGLAPRSREAPTGYQFGKRKHIVLGIAAVDSQCVQLKDFTGQVLVEAAVEKAAGRRRRPYRERVVEIKDHRRVFDHRHKEVCEAAGDIGPNRFALVRPGEAGDDGTGG